jgi:hypothetical protein
MDRPIPPTTTPSAPTDDIAGSISQVIADLAELGAHLPAAGDGVARVAAARVAACLAGETAQAAAMIRALPGRPRAMPGHSYAAVEALATAATAQADFSGWLAAMLCHAAARLGSTGALTSSRPGSWEAALVQQLVAGTAGQGDEMLNSVQDLLAPFRDRWEIEPHSDGLVLTAVRTSPDGRQVRVIVAATAWELAAKLAAAETAEP